MADWWRRNATVRLQTTFVAVAVTGVALSLGAFAVLKTVRGDIRSRVHQQVEDVANQVAKQIPMGLTPRAFVLRSTVGEGFVPPSVVVTDLDTGRVVFQFEPGLAVDDLMATDPGLPQAGLRLGPANTAGSDEIAAELISEKVDVTTGFGRFRVVASSPASIVSKNTAALQASLFVGFPALAVLVGLVTWLLTGRSLRPVERMRAQVEEISAHTLDRRVPTPGTEDEIGRLAHTMNRMLGRLESSATRQREFVSDASHELRSPIAAIRSELEVALRDPAHAEWLAVAANTLAENERLERLVDDLLTLARLDEGHVPAVEDVDLEDVIREEVARLHDERVHPQVSPVRVRGNREQIARAVRNLLENAGRFAVDRIDLLLSVDDGGAVVAVSDDGPGIQEEDRERIFERFTRLDEGRARNHGGVGLGLALVRAIAQAHGGTASVADAAVGTRIVVRLPAVEVAEPVSGSIYGRNLTGSQT